MSDMAPDPSTNTAPPPSEGLAAAETDWDFLEKMEGAPGDAPANFQDDPDDELTPSGAVKTEPGDKPAETPPADDKPADETPPATEPVTAEIPPEVKEQVEMFSEFDQALKEDPAAVASAIFEKMDARQKAQFLQYVGVKDAAYPEFDIENYTPGEDDSMEKDLKARYQDIRSIPQVIRETRELDGRLGQVHEEFKQGIQSLVPHISESNVMSELSLAKIDAICEVLGISLPDPNWDALSKEIKPGVKYRDAVRKLVDYGTAIEMGKQAKAPRPSKQTDNSTKREGSPEGSDNWSAVDWAHHFGTIPKR